MPEMVPSPGPAFEVPGLESTTDGAGGRAGLLLSLMYSSPPSQPAAERSKTVILVKNLPAGTLAAELQETFGRFGSLGRVLLPEGGVTAIVEFLEPLEARKAFRHLAYSKVGAACAPGDGSGRSHGLSRAWPVGAPLNAPALC